MSDRGDEFRANHEHCEALVRGLAGETIRRAAISIDEAGHVTAVELILGGRSVEIVGWITDRALGDGLSVASAALSVEERLPPEDRPEPA